MSAWLRWQATCLADDIRRYRNNLRTLWRSGGRGRHSLAWGETLPDVTPTVDITAIILPRKPVSGRPPWETAELPAVCLMPQYVPDPVLHPVVQAAIEEQLGADSIGEFVQGLMGPLLAAVGA